MAALKVHPKPDIFLFFLCFLKACRSHDVRSHQIPSNPIKSPHIITYHHISFHIISSHIPAIKLGTAVSAAEAAEATAKVPLPCGILLDPFSCPGFNGSGVSW